MFQTEFPKAYSKGLGTHSLISTRIHCIQSKIQDLYQTNYNKLDPNSIKFLEYKSLHKDKSKDASYQKKTAQQKDVILENLQKNHIHLKNRNQIIDLPKLPWGVHLNYNTDTDFVEEHFNTSTEEKLKKFNKNLRLLSKIVKKKTNKESKKLNDFHGESQIYKTHSGIMVCKKQLKTEKSYEEANVKYKRVREFEFENEADVKDMIERIKDKKRICSSREVVKRLYTPNPRVERFSKLSEKYKQLFDTAIEK